MPLEVLLELDRAGRASSEEIVVALGAVLDVDYVEDSAADVDMNVVRTDAGRYVEIQGTGEDATFARDDLDSLLELADVGIGRLLAQQKELLGDLLPKIVREP